MNQVQQSLPLGSVSLDNSSCNKCGLCSTRGKVINGYGNLSAKIVMISDIMSDYEESKGQPLQGMNSFLFDKLLKDAGLSRKDVFITSVLRCKGKPATAKLMQESVDACIGYLQQEIEAIKPNIIVPLGSLALRTVLANRTANITKQRGILQYSEKFKCKILPIFHPSYLMQMPQYEQVTIQDLQRVNLESMSSTPVPSQQRDYRAITTLEAFDSFYDEYFSAPVLACDIETTGLDWQRDQTIGVSFCKDLQSAVYVPLVKGEGSLAPFWEDSQDYVLNKIKTMLHNSSAKVFHNGTYDIKLLHKNLGINVNNFQFDTMLADHLIDENARGLHGLENCALRYTDFGNYKQPVVSWFKDQKIPESKRDYNLLPNSLLHPYGAADALVTFTLRHILGEKLKELQLTRLFQQVVMPTQQLFIETEFRGVNLDIEYLDSLGIKYSDKVLDLEQKIYRLVGEFKIGSAKQLQKVLFDDLKLPVISHTKSGARGTDKEVLKALVKRHPVIEYLLEYKLLSKLLSTYVNGLKEKLGPDGKLHTSYLLTGTTTGRISSRQPNLQNIPARSNDIQNAFMAGPGRTFIAADYSQAEFRAWANFSKDPQMLKDLAMGKGFDIHKTIASIIFGIPQDKITKDQRNLAKTCVFGNMYGRGAASIAEQFKVSPKEAERIINYIKQRYPVGFRWINQQQQLAEKTGEVKTHFGRIRHLRAALSSFNREVRAKALRLAVNSPVQGTVGDLNNIAALRVTSRLRKEGIDGYLALTIHDALIFNVDVTKQDQAVKCLREEMERPVEGFIVPMAVDIKIGDRWGAVQKQDDIPVDLDAEDEETDEE